MMLMKSFIFLLLFVEVRQTPKEIISTKTTIIVSDGNTMRADGKGT